MGYRVSDARFTGRQDGRGSWTLEIVNGRRYFEVERGNRFEPL
ncbi:hypothetical protein EDD94_5682, partial [Streptomyces sp. PanSC9]